MTATFLGPPAPTRTADLHVAFRGHLRIETDGPVEIRLLGASWYRAFLDGEVLAEGPPRFPRDNPEFSVLHRRVEPGAHLIAVHLHHDGVVTRILEDLPPFLFCEVLDRGEPVEIAWRCSELPAYVASGRRSSPLFGWIEWCDTRALPDWTKPEFLDDLWPVPVPVDPGIGPLEPLSTAEVRSFDHRLRPVAEGKFAETMGFYELDDPAARFFTRDLGNPDEPDGVWRRYDLGRVHLATPRFVLALPEGAVVEFGCADYLTGGRVAPYYPGSTGPTCTVDHFVARGGIQEFYPLTPKGMRFLELHVIAPPARVGFVQEGFVERGYYGPAEGSFTCDDPTLNRIWSMTIDTLRACAEDALVDTPTRERGQWMGDVATVGLEIAGVAWADLRLIRRGLVHSAQCASPEGFIAGLSPGTTLPMSSYAAQWVTACVEYVRKTGDRSILAELFPAARKNMDAFRRHLRDDGIGGDLPWTFIDWGYVPRPAGKADMGLNLHVLAAARDLAWWARALDATETVESCKEMAKSLEDTIRTWLGAALAPGDGAGWDEVGYHCAILALRLGLLSRADEPNAVAYCKRHIERCYPNDPSAPRLAHPMVQETRLITPYFSHYAFPELIERGEMTFVQRQWTRCWGWMLDRGATTLLEVFDHRWSQCHQWAGAPAWQLSRYVLGLHSRFDRADRSFDFRLAPGVLRRAEGALPLPRGEGLVRVRWERDGGTIAYEVRTDAPITIRMPGGETREISHIWEQAIPQAVVIGDAVQGNDRPARNP